MAKGLITVISGPSGAGKGTVVGKLIESGDYALSVSATTRTPREGEKDGVNYHFKTRNEFEQMIDNGDFLEYAEYCSNYYGTPLPYVRQKLEEGKNVILEIEVQGAFQIKEKAPDAVLIFLAPPSMEVLEERLRGRGTESEEVIRTRLEQAKNEVKLVKDYDYIVVNNTVDEAVSDINSILRAETLKVSRSI